MDSAQGGPQAQHQPDETSLSLEPSYDPSEEVMLELDDSEDSDDEPTLSYMPDNSSPAPLISVNAWEPIGIIPALARSRRVGSVEPGLTLKCLLALEDAPVSFRLEDSSRRALQAIIGTTS